jgi:hypothetical protein
MHIIYNYIDALMTTPLIHQIQTVNLKTNIKQIFNDYDSDPLFREFGLEPQ